MPGKPPDPDHNEYPERPNSPESDLRDVPFEGRPYEPEWAKSDYDPDSAASRSRSLEETDRYEDSQIPRFDPSEFDGAIPPDEHDLNREDGDDSGGKWLVMAGRVMVVAALLGFIVPMILQVFSVSSSTASGPVEVVERLPEFVTAQVTSVIDGNTIRVEYDGKTDVVRYIGVGSPAVGEPLYEFATETNRRWVGDQTIQMVGDKLDRDPEGRLLRYVQVDEIFININLLAAGLGRNVVRPPNDLFSQQFAEVEKNARLRALGIWAPDAGSQDSKSTDTSGA